MSNMLDVNLSLLPEGAAWNVAGDYLSFLKANSNNKEVVRNFLKTLSIIRAPLKTEYLENLEREFGIEFTDGLTEEQRRQNLLSTKTSIGSLGEDYFENILVSAGFDVQVHRNSPAVDPTPFLSDEYFMVDGNENAVDGNENAIDGIQGGYLLANGPVFDQSPDWISVDGNENMVDGNENAVDGRFDRLKAVEINPVLDCGLSYSTLCGNYLAVCGNENSILGGTSSQCWKYIFFIGGDVTRGVNGEITDIEFATVQTTKRLQFETLILKYKPVHTWAAVIVNYIE